MKPQPILVTSAVLLMSLGGITLFAPEEVAALLAISGQATGAMVLQLLGGALFALGFLDWMNRFATIGGIYGRPVVAANLAFFFIAATTLARRALRAGVPSDRATWVALTICALFAVGYARIMFAPSRSDAGSVPSNPKSGDAS